MFAVVASVVSAAAAVVVLIPCVLWGTVGAALRLLPGRKAVGGSQTPQAVIFALCPHMDAKVLWISRLPIQMYGL